MDNRRKRGALKDLVLQALADGEYHYPSQIGCGLPFRRPGQLHAYLLRLQGRGLVERTLDRWGKRYGYRLTGEGCRLVLRLHAKQRPASAGAGSAP